MKVLLCGQVNLCVGREQGSNHIGLANWVILSHLPVLRSFLWKTGNFAALHFLQHFPTSLLIQGRPRPAEFQTVSILSLAPSLCSLFVWKVLKRFYARLFVRVFIFLMNHWIHFWETVKNKLLDVHLPLIKFPYLQTCLFSAKFASFNWQCNLHEPSRAKEFFLGVGLGGDQRHGRWHNFALTWLT